MEETNKKMNLILKPGSWLSMKWSRTRYGRTVRPRMVGSGRTVPSRRVSDPVSRYGRMVRSRVTVSGRSDDR